MISVTTGSRVVVWRLPVPPPFTSSMGATSRTAATTAARRSRDLGGGAALDRPDRGTLPASRERAVAEPGDVRLVAHQPGELEPRPAHDLGRELARLRGRAHG